VTNRNDAVGAQGMRNDWHSIGTPHCVNRLRTPQKLNTHQVMASVSSEAERAGFVRGIFPIFLLDSNIRRNCRFGDGFHVCCWSWLLAVVWHQLASISAHFQHTLSAREGDSRNGNIDHSWSAVRPLITAVIQSWVKPKVWMNGDADLLFIIAVGAPFRIIGHAD
jgi:hypothetical protein